MHLERSVEYWLARDDRFYHNIFDPSEQPFIVDLVFAKHLSQGFKAPFGSASFLFSSMLGDRAMLVILIDRVVRQMDEPVLLANHTIVRWSLVLGRGKSDEPLIVHVDAQRVKRGHCHVDS